MGLMCLSAGITSIARTLESLREYSDVPPKRRGAFNPWHRVISQTDRKLSSQIPKQKRSALQSWYCSAEGYVASVGRFFFVVSFR